MIKTIIAPLLFATLVVGIAGHPNLRHVGRMGVKALVYFEVVTTLALFIGLAAINLTRAGVGVQPPEGLPPAGVTGAKQTVSDVVLHAFPENVAKSVAEGQVLQVVVFSILFAIALSLLPERRRKPMLSLAEGLSETMFKFTNLVMLFAPVGRGRGHRLHRRPHGPRHPREPGEAPGHPLPRALRLPALRAPADRARLARSRSGGS